MEVVDYDEYQAEMQRRKRERWLGKLAGEKPGRVPGRRPRDPEKERILAKMDRERLIREGLVPVALRSASAQRRGHLHRSRHHQGS